MEKNRSVKYIAIIALIVGLIASGIAFAAFSTTLTINGTADVKASKWLVRFENLKAVEKTGEAEEVTAPTINTNDTNIGDYKVTLKVPGDKISYTFDVANRGTFDASITTLTIPTTPTCTGTGDSKTQDETNVCKNVTYKLTYDNGTEVKVGDKLSADEVKTMKLELTYLASTLATELPVNDVALSDLGISIIYSQD